MESLELEMNGETSTIKKSPKLRALNQAKIIERQKEFSWRIKRREFLEAKEQRKKQKNFPDSMNSEMEKSTPSSSSLNLLQQLKGMCQTAHDSNLNIQQQTATESSNQNFQIVLNLYCSDKHARNESRSSCKNLDNPVNKTLNSTNCTMPSNQLPTLEDIIVFNLGKPKTDVTSGINKTIEPSGLSYFPNSRDPLSSIRNDDSVYCSACNAWTNLRSYHEKHSMCLKETPDAIMQIPVLDIRNISEEKLQALTQLGFLSFVSYDEFLSNNPGTP